MAESQSNKRQIAGRISTEVDLISTLITGISKGEIKIPKFQRAFVWKEVQALNLLDSIANNYPIGSLLLWRTKERLPVERNIGEFSLPSTDDMEPTDYVLDGQQRLTVIYSCLGAKEADGGFAAAYDLAEEKFLRMSDVTRFHQFPIRKIFNTTQLLNFRAAIQNDPKGALYQERLDSLIGAFADYRIPVVRLKDLTVEEVCPIFERINSSGTRLSTYDLMVAATWKTDFDLNDEVEEIRDTLTPKGFGDIDRETILKCLSAVHLGTIKEQSLMTLRTLSNVEMRGLISKTKSSLLKTIDILSTEFGIYSWDFLSYEALAVIICYTYANINHLSRAEIQRLRQWFWRSAFGERYKVGGESFVSSDLTAVSKFIAGGNGNASTFGYPPSAKEWLQIGFRSNVSRSRAYVLALASRRPRNLTNGSLIDTTTALSSYNKKQFHHVFPRAHLKRIKTQRNDNLCINICLLSAVGNNAVSDADPNLYLPQIVQQLGKDADNVFISNLLPEPSKFDYSSASYEQFLEERAKAVSAYTECLCAGS